MAYASNCPVSRPAKTTAEIHREMGGFAWNDKIGMFIPSEGELPPIKLPRFDSYRPLVR